MLSIYNCQNLINQHLNALRLPVLPADLYDPIRYMLKIGAKRLRPSLVLMGCNLYSDTIDRAVNPAMAIELFHNFTLMHDDIMDKSVIRRNRSTVHVKWNQNVAILSGDAMLIKAYELLAKDSGQILERILPVFNQTALLVCEGQQYDMDYEQSTDVSIEDYLKMVEYKTAVLLAASLKIGALIGGAEDDDADLLYEFGRNIGIAFQLQDDLLDVFADPEIFGKAKGNDIVSNKKTILLVEALHIASGSTLQNLKDWMNRKDFEREEKIYAVSSIYEKLALEKTIESSIRQYHQLALDNLQKLSVEQVRKSKLLDFSSYLLNRKK